jgi:hypothetical protein
MKLTFSKITLWISAAVLVAGLLASATKFASAQSDRTLGINCTVAGHAHCGETSPIGGPSYWHHRRRHPMR